MDNGMSPADFAAMSGGAESSSWWIIILFLFAFCGFGNGGLFGGNAGAAENYTLASDFATLQRQISDSTGSTERKLDSITNGICELGYANAQLINGVSQQLNTQGYETRNAITQAQITEMQNTNALQAQLSNCCCENKSAIADLKYSDAMNTNAIQNAISNGFCQTNYNMATQNNTTLQAIDKVGDRVIDYLANKENQTLRDENFALKLSASQQAQNNYLVNALGNNCGCNYNTYNI